MIAALAMVAVFVAVLALPVYEAIRDMRVAWREEAACERIGVCQVRGVVARLSVADVFALAAERKR